MELLDTILIVTGCKSTEQLKDLPPERRSWLAHSLEERVPSGLASIEEWNELLKLFMDAPAETENKIAKKKLLCFCAEKSMGRISLLRCIKANGGNLRTDNRKQEKHWITA